MRKILAPRASVILYNLLRERPRRLPFLLPANICPIVPITFFKAGVPFEFVDISPRTLSMDTGTVIQRIREAGGQYGGVLYAHAYGDAATPDEFLRELKDRWSHLLVIDDRCLCIPEFEPSGETVADAILFSTGYAKIVDLGIGGYAFLSDATVYQPQRLPFAEEALRELEAGYKAAIHSSQPYAYYDSAWLQTEADLPSWGAYAERVHDGLQQTMLHRQQINAVYNSIIPAELQLGNAYQLWRFNLRSPNKDAALRAIFEAGLFASSHYRSLVGIMGEGFDTHARELASQVLNLFNDHRYTVDMAEHTARIVMRSL